MVKEEKKNSFYAPTPYGYRQYSAERRTDHSQKNSWVGRYNADMAADSMATDYSHWYNTLFMSGKILRAA